MCGIAGIWNASDEETVRRMTDRIAHRGPDASGVRSFHGPSSQVTLGHRRLSIIDLSPDGTQPMRNETGDVWVVFNGEIYNFPEIKEQLLSKGHIFASKTDTEILVHGWEEWGIDLLPKLNGIFAFALWDGRTGKLLLARDRFGTKPLYIKNLGDRVYFASEMKALLVVPGATREVNREAVVAMARYRFTPEPITLFRNIRKLEPGWWIEYSTEGERSRQFSSPAWLEPDARTSRGSAGELREVLQAAATRQLIADVPVGFFLSGGLDSSCLVAMTHEALKGRRTKSFTVGFRREDQKDEGQVDDLIYARQIAQKFGLDHQEIILEPKIVDLLPEVIWHLDEPIADPATITSWLICEAAKKEGIKVLLSGQGGDEIFAGYPWHLGAGMGRFYRKSPRWLRWSAESIASKLSSTAGGSLAGPLRRFRKFMESASRPFDDCLLGFLSYAEEKTLSELFGGNYLKARGMGWPDRTHRALLAEASGLHWINRMLHLDIGTFLPSLNLTYTDKTSMAHSLEVRVPLLDNEVADYMASVSPDLKLRGKTRKYLLKKSMEGVLPHEVICRKKGGFGAPIRTWIRRELKEMIRDLLSPSQVAKRGFFVPEAVTSILERNDRGEQDFSYLIYFLLSFEIWCQKFLDPPPTQA